MTARTAAVGLLAGVLALLSPSSADAQMLALGGRLDWNTTTFDETVAAEGTFGIGAKVMVRLPLIGLRVEGTGDLYFPDCPDVDCDLNELGLNVLWSVPTPLIPVDPYLGLGVTRQSAQSPGLDDSEVGLAIVGGVSAGTGLRLFAEGRYLVMNDFDDQLVLSGGVMIPLVPDLPAG